MSNQFQDDDWQGTPPIGDMPDFKPVVTEEQFKELSHLPEEQRNLVMPVIRALSISDQRAKHHYRYTVIHNQSIRRIERSKKRTLASASGVALWILTVVLSSVLLALASKYIHP